MKILLETMSFRPNISGVAITVERLANYLIENGHQVILITPARKLLSSVEKVSDNLTIYRLRAYPNLMRRGFYLPFMVRGLVEHILNVTQPDIIHVNDPLALSRYLQYGAKKRGIPTIASNHFSFDYILAYLPKFAHPAGMAYFKLWMVRFYNRCQAVIAPSETVAEMLRENGVRTKVLALSNGVDLHRFFADFSLPKARRELGLDNRPVILYVGRIDKDKSLDILLKAAAIVTQKINCQFVLVGGGNLLKKFQNKTIHLKLTSKIKFLGVLPANSWLLVALYQLASVFVMPSSIETQSISTLEAMAAGRPIVAANSGALPELVENGVNGLLFAPGNATMLAEKLMELMNNRDSQDKFGRISLIKVSEHELEKSLSLFVDLYNRCLVTEN